MKYQFYRKIGLFEATLYLENQHINDPSSEMYLAPTAEVCVFGEFSPLDPWNVHVPCIYCPYYKCFKADIMIRTGQQFKFVISGRHVDNAYIISERYPFCLDDLGNINNVFIPAQIQRVNSRRKPSQNYDNR